LSKGGPKCVKRASSPDRRVRRARDERLRIFRMPSARRQLADVSTVRALSKACYYASKRNILCVLHVPDVRITLDIGRPAGQVKLSSSRRIWRKRTALRHHDHTTSLELSQIPQGTSDRRWSTSNRVSVAKRSG
jgi:hypothetical protein